jgi:hypothetical protein
VPCQSLELPVRSRMSVHLSFKMGHEMSTDGKTSRRERVRYLIMTIDPIYIPAIQNIILIQSKAHMIGGRTDTCTVQYVIVHTGSLSGSSTKTTSGGSSECQRLVADGTRTISSRGGRPLLYRSISLRCLRRPLYLT